jgi:hypothetical protein
VTVVEVVERAVMWVTVAWALAAILALVAAIQSSVEAVRPVVVEVALRGLGTSFALLMVL